MRSLPILLIAGIMAQGCITAGTGEISGEAGAAGGARDPVVIALIDTGLNPYHEIFHTAVPGVVEAAAEEVRLASSGDLNERIDADEAFWRQAQTAHLYHFEGTRLYGITFTSRPDLRMLDATSHGAAVAYLAAREADDAVIVMIQAWLGSCDDSPDCIQDESIALAMEWAAEQSWIDVISTSVAFVGNPPLAGPMEEVGGRWLAAAERAAQKGIVLVNAAGNEAIPPLSHHTNGPPWVISVGGFEHHARGEHWNAAKGVDVVANYSDIIEQSELGLEDEWVVGTSFAAPIVAGTIAKAMSMIQASGASWDTGDLRSALNASAVLVDPTEWDPRPPEREDPVRDAAQYLSLPVLTQAQMGWGYVNGSIALEIARRVLEGDLAPPAEKDQAILVQAEYQRAREEYWANWPR